jgi:hypothetical protein
MTASAQAALDAMAAAEQEARVVVDEWVNTELSVRWARDRVRLADLHRETLELHEPTDYDDGKLASCEVCGVHSPCHDLQAVIRYWCHDEETP